MDSLVPLVGIPPALQQHLRSLAGGFLPEAAEFSESDWLAMGSIIGSVLAERPAATRRQIGSFVRLVALIALARYGRPLSRLRPEQVRAVLQRLERSPLLLIRRGTWGLRTLVFMGYYTRPEAAAAIGYLASPAGWAARR